MKKLYLLFILFTACIEPVEIQSSSSQSFMVIEGLLTDLYGSHVVKVSRSQPINTEGFNQVVYEPRSGAIVTLSDDEGNNYSYSEGIAGTYTLNDFKGEPGKSYMLTVEIDGSTYQSEMEVMRPAVPIDTLYFEHNLEEEVLEVYVDVNDPAGERNYYSWLWDGYYEIVSNLPEPVTCCNRCFVDELGDDIIIEDDEFLNGNKIRRKPIMNIRLDQPSRYFLEVTQLSIKREDYQYLQILQRQRNEGVGLYDPQPLNNRGNIYNVDDQNETVLGYFLTAGADKTELGTRRRPYFTRLSYIVFQNDCRLLPNTDTIPPTNWPF